VLGKSLGLDESDLAALDRGGFLHDIGKIAVPDSILLKGGALNAQESRVMREHPIIGDALCAGLRSFSKVRPIVRHHHERLDGSGYPDGLRNREVPLLAQIVGIVDVFDALTTERPYRAARTREEAFQALTEEATKGWRDRALVDAFVAVTEDVTADPGGVQMAKYGKKASEKIEKAMHERKHGTLRSGGSGKKVKSRKQAIAIGLSEARRAGGKVPRKRTGGRKRKAAGRKK
jgi:HD-GYP domain-containing protein (c-di-GMP phosphodiesterase class II)